MPAPANDDFASATAISGASGTAGPVTITDATTEASEPTVGSGGIRQTAWYTWTAPADGFVRTFLHPELGVGRLGLIVVYTGAALGSLVNVTGFGGVASSGAEHAALPFQAVAGTTYRIQIGANFDGGAATGTVALRWEIVPPPANDDFADALTLTTGVTAGPIDVAGATVEASEPSPSVMGGDGPFQTSWYEWTAPFDCLAELDMSGSIGDSGGGFNEWIIAAYTGSTLGTLVEAAAADLVGSTTLSFPALSGVIYRIQVGTWGVYDTALVQLRAQAVLAPRLPQSWIDRPWRFVVTRLDPTPGSESVVETVSFLDRRARDRTHTKILNRASCSTGTVASDDPEINIPHDDGEPFLAEGSRCLLGFRREGGSPPWKIRSAELLLQLEDTVENGIPVTHYTALSPLELLNHRRVLKSGGSLPDAQGLKFTSVKGNEIALTLLKRTIDTDGSCFIDFGEDWGGTSFWGGTIEDTDELDVIEFQRAAMVGEAWAELVQTGTLDIVLTPIYDDDRPGYLCEGSIYAQAGTEKPNAIFAWDKPPHTLVGIGRLEDGTKRANKIQFVPGQGGTPIAVQTDATSVTDFGEWWSIPTWPGKRDEIGLLALAQEQLLLRKRRQTTVTINPAPASAPVPLIEYDLGDRVPVWASKALRKAITGYQRIYGIPLKILDEGEETVDQLLVSADSVT